MSTLTGLEARWPAIEWRKPLPVAWPDGRYYACRVCIANKGLKRDSAWQWLGYADAGRHIALEHERAT